MENEENIKSGKKERFDQEKECRLSMMCHRFIRTSDPFWELVREKLIHMRDLYGGKHAVQLCPVCLTIFVSGNPKKHPKTPIGSLFFEFDPSEKTSKEVAELFKNQGRVKKLQSGDVLVGIPSFGQICVENHRSLEGSSIQYKPDGKIEETSREEAREILTQRMQKRPPKKTEGGEVGKKHIKNGVKKKLWVPSLKGRIPEFPSINPADLKETPVKSYKASERKEL